MVDALGPFRLPHRAGSAREPDCGPRVGSLDHLPDLLLSSDRRSPGVELTLRLLLIAAQWGFVANSVYGPRADE